VQHRSLSVEEVQGRWCVLLLVLGLHLALWLVIEVAVRPSLRPVSISPAMLWLQFAAPRRSAQRPARERPRITVVVPAAPTAPARMPVESEHAGAIASNPAVTPPAVDWHREAERAARAELAAEAASQKINGAIGGTPFSNFNARRNAPRASFPWSRQPLSRAFDFDPDSFELSLNLGKRCRLTFFMLVPALGCVLGSINPEPGRADLFDPKFRPAPIELPVPALAQQPAR
jgi:hypothetical protein